MEFLIYRILKINDYIAFCLGSGSEPIVSVATDALEDKIRWLLSQRDNAFSYIDRIPE